MVIADSCGQFADSTVCRAVFLGTYSHAAPEKDRPIANAIGAAIDAALA